MTDPSKPHPNVAYHPKGLRWRRILPWFQLLICSVVLFPIRGAIFDQIYNSLFGYRSEHVNNYAVFRSRVEALPESRPKIVQAPAGLVVLQLPEKQRRAIEINQIRMLVPAAINFPAVLVDLPYSMFSEDRKEWTPKGMYFELWRAISWPVVGMFFWWIAGRGIDALAAARQEVIFPRLTIIDVVVGSVVLAAGLLVLVMMLVEGGKDRADPTLAFFTMGGGVWAALGAVSVIGRLAQWRLRVRARWAESSADAVKVD
jgi:hypothetical protein